MSNRISLPGAGPPRPAYDRNFAYDAEEGGAFVYVVTIDGSLPQRAIDTDPIEVILEAWSALLSSAGAGVAMLRFSGSRDSHAGAAAWLVSKVVGVRYAQPFDEPAEDEVADDDTAPADDDDDISLKRGGGR